MWDFLRGMEGSPSYVYGVIEQEDLEFETTGVDGAERVYTVDQSSLSAVASDVESVEPERTDENVRAHNDVLQETLEHGDGRSVVPMQFGMAFKDEATLKNLLKGAQATFRHTLDEVEGKVELGLKVVAGADADVDPMRIQQEAAERFDELAVATERGSQFSDRLVLNRSYLIDREDQEAFNEAVGTFEADYPDLLVQYTGPWPPYNFVDIEIGAKQ